MKKRCLSQPLLVTTTRTTPSHELLLSPSMEPAASTATSEWNSSKAESTTVLTPTTTASSPFLKKHCRRNTPICDSVLISREKIGCANPSAIEATSTPNASRFGREPETKVKQVTAASFTATQVKSQCAIVVEANLDHDYQVDMDPSSSSLHREASARHLERPKRITAIWNALHQSGLLERCLHLVQSPNNNLLLTREILESVHLPAYLQRLDRLKDYSTITFTTLHPRLQEEAAQYESVYLTSQSYEAALTAAAALCTLVRHVVLNANRQSQQQESVDTDSKDTTVIRNHSTGFAIIRPPGHHAERFQACGYCILNNVALAASYATMQLRIPKILIVDWDVHFGNGTQAAFEHNPRVLYFSVHRRNCFPFSSSSNSSSHRCLPSHVGTGNGTRYTVNIAWSKSRMGDLEYRAAWKYVLLPILKEFDPDLVLIAAGFDAAASDIGDCCVTPEGYAALTRQILDALQSLRPSSTAPVIGALEGGYQPRVLGQCVVAVIQELLQSTLKNKKDGGRQSSLNVSAENCSSDDDLDLWKVIQTSAARDIRQTVQALRPHWACLHKNDS